MNLKHLPIMLVVLALFCMTGCMNHQLTSYGAIDKNAHTVSVAPGFDGLNGKLKDLLKNEGWQIVAESGAKEINATGAKKATHPDAPATTRYRLRVTTKQYDFCSHRADPAYRYEIAMLDNQAGDDVMTMAGSGCEYLIVERFRNWLLTAQKK